MNEAPQRSEWSRMLVIQDCTRVDSKVSSRSRIPYSTASSMPMLARSPKEASTGADASNATASGEADM